MLPIFYTAFFYLLWIQYGMVGVHKDLLCNCKFYSRQHSKSHTSRRGISEFLSVLSIVIIQLGLNLV